MAEQKRRVGWLRRVAFTAVVAVPVVLGGAAAHAASPVVGQAAGTGPVVTAPVQQTAASGRNLGALPRAGLGVVLVALALWSRARHQRRVVTT